MKEHGDNLLLSIIIPKVAYVTEMGPLHGKTPINFKFGNKEYLTNDLHIYPDFGKLWHSTRLLSTSTCSHHC